MTTISYLTWCRERACDGKIAYLSELTARNTATALRWRDGRILHPYRCSFCSTAEHPNWHLGHDKDTP